MPEASEPVGQALPPRSAEALLIDALPRLATPARAVCLSLGRAQFALAAVAHWPSTAIECLYLDLYRAELARAAISTPPPNLTIRCDTTFVASAVELAALPFTAQGEADLVRDLLQMAYERLTIGGVCLTATDNPRDTWLHEQVVKLFGTAERSVSSAGVCYRAIKTGALKKRKDYSATFVFRDGPQLFQALTVPGVFSHRRVDPGARRLLDQLTLPALGIAPTSRVLDMGCGWGAVALAAAARVPQGHVLALDSAPRAIACTQHNAALNGLTNIICRLSATGECDAPGTYDVVLANPPYYANFRIAELFLTAAQQALRRGGRLVVVTKSADWYLEHLPDNYQQVELIDAKGYQIVRGMKV